jgi:large subunit ribosomal protein L22
MDVVAVTKFVRISPEKAMHVARLLQGKKVADALGIVELSPRKAAYLMGKTLRSAIANAENNHDLDRGSLYVKEALVGAGPIMKRFRPKARGMAGRILKRTSHFRIVLSNEKN